MISTEEFEVLTGLVQNNIWLMSFFGLKETPDRIEIKNPFFGQFSRLLATFFGQFGLFFIKNRARKMSIVSSGEIHMVKRVNLLSIIVNIDSQRRHHYSKQEK